MGDGSFFLLSFLLEGQTNVPPFCHYPSHTHWWMSFPLFALFSLIYAFITRKMGRRAAGPFLPADHSIPSYFHSNPGSKPSFPFPANSIFPPRGAANLLGLGSIPTPNSPLFIHSHSDAFDQWENAMIWKMT